MLVLNSVLEMLNTRLTVPASNIDEAITWTLRADSIRLDGWVDKLTAIESKVAAWKVSDENVERVTRQLDSMQNRALMLHTHRDQKTSTSESFLDMLKKDVAGNPFSAKHESLFNVALFAGANPKRDDNREQVKAIMLSTIPNDKLNIDMPALTLSIIKDIGSRNGWIKTDSDSYTPVVIDENRKLTEDEKRRLSAKDQAVFLCLHERARRSFDASAAKTYESLRDTYVPLDDVEACTKAKNGKP